MPVSFFANKTLINQRLTQALKLQKMSSCYNRQFGYTMTDYIYKKQRQKKKYTRAVERAKEKDQNMRVRLRIFFDIFSKTNNDFFTSCRTLYI